MVLIVLRALRGSNDARQNESMDIKYGARWDSTPVPRRRVADLGDSHHTLTLACGDKLHLAPLEKDKIQVGPGTHPPTTPAIVSPSS